MLRGKRREFAIGLVLTVITFGIYPLFWHYLAFKELYDQERRDDFPIGLYICSFIPIIGIVCELLYISKQIDFINNLRVQQGLAPSIGLGEFLLWVVVGQLIVVGPPIAYAKLQGSINELWANYSREQALPRQAMAAA